MIGFYCHDAAGLCKVRGIKMIRVLHIYDSTVINAGINIEIMNWFRSVDRSECQFDFLSSWKREPNFDKEIERLGGNSYYISQNAGMGNLFKFILEVKSFMKKNASKYSIVHLHTGPLCFPYLYYARKYGIKVRIVHAHSLSSGNTWVTSARNNLLLLPMRHLATHFFACSKEAARQWFERRKISDYYVINNGISLNIYKESATDRKSVRAELGLSDYHEVILHISNMSIIKNIPFLIKVFEQVYRKRNNCRLLLVGKNELPQEAKQLIRKYGLEKKVINYGVADNVARIINGSDVCLMPSKAEGFGLVPIECQSCKKYVLISEGFPSVIDATPYVYRIPLDIERWVNKTCDILDYKVQVKDVNIGNLLNAFEIGEIAGRVLDQYKICVGERK